MQRDVRRPVEIRDFPGLQTNIDSHDAAEGGAQIQVNATCVTPSELKVRKGMQVLTFEN